MAWSDLDQHGPRFGVLDEGNYPIAIDGNTVWIAAQDGDYEWAVPKQATRQTKPSTFVVDVENLTRLERVGDHTRWWGPDLVEPVEVDARAIALSPDGHVGLFRSEDGEPILFRDGIEELAIRHRRPMSGMLRSGRTALSPTSSRRSAHRRRRTPSGLASRPGHLSHWSPATSPPPSARPSSPGSSSNVELPR